jgi:hypothetical protein
VRQAARSHVELLSGRGEMQLRHRGTGLQARLATPAHSSLLKARSD